MTVDRQDIGTGLYVDSSTAYTFLGDGTLLVDAVISPSDSRLILPRVGLRAILDAALSRVTYYGRGPVANYCDRKSSQTIGRYDANVEDFYEDFVRPQSMGNRCDMQWMALRDQQGNGALIDAMSPLSFTTLRFTEQALAAAAHPYELVPADGIVLSLDGAHTGLGGASCGPGPLEKYTHRGPARVRFSVRPLNSREDPAVKARSTFSVVPSVVINRNGQGQLSLDGVDRGDVRVTIDGQPVEASPEAQKITEGGVITAAPIGREKDSIPAVATTRVFSPKLDRSAWNLTVSSEDTDGPAAHLIDDNPQTFWHTRWQHDAPLPPHDAVIDFGEPLLLKGVQVMPRQGISNGRVERYRLEVSNDGKVWREAVSGQLPDRETPSVIGFSDEQTVRYLRFIALSSYFGPWTSMAEIKPIVAGKRASPVLPGLPD